MEIEIHNTKEDYSNFYKYFYFKRAIVAKVFIAFAVATLFFGGKYSETKFETIPLDNFLKLLSLGILIFGLITFVPYIIALRRLASIAGTSKSPEGKKKFILTETGLQVETETENNLWSWESIRTADISDEFAFILLYTHRVYIIPTKYFNSEKDIQSFIGFIQNSALKVKTKSPQRKVWRLYWWGLLGFIPLIGGITGLVLLLRGIFEFKDKFLILIGSACILFTIGVYSFLFHEMKFGKETGNNFAQISQMQLNGLVKDIEFYKFQYGNYPDSLQQIQKDNSFISIVAPLLLRKSTSGNLNYQYQIIGNKYKLYSVGIDGIANTADDIYPTLTISDTSKIGFIKK